MRWDEALTFFFIACRPLVLSFRFVCISVSSSIALKSLSDNVLVDNFEVWAQKKKKNKKKKKKIKDNKRMQRIFRGFQFNLLGLCVLRAKVASLILSRCRGVHRSWGLCLLSPRHHHTPPWSMIVWFIDCTHSEYSCSQLLNLSNLKCNTISFFFRAVSLWKNEIEFAYIYSHWPVLLVIAITESNRIFFFTLQHRVSVRACVSLLN